jgi:hypothetical protein
MRRIDRPCISPALLMRGVRNQIGVHAGAAHKLTQGGDPKLQAKSMLENLVSDLRSHKVWRKSANGEQNGAGASVSQHKVRAENSGNTGAFGSQTTSGDCFASWRW